MCKPAAGTLSGGASLLGAAVHIWLWSLKALGGINAFTGQPMKC